MSSSLLSTMASPQGADADYDFCIDSSQAPKSLAEKEATSDTTATSIELSLEQQEIQRLTNRKELSDKDKDRQAWEQESQQTKLSLRIQEVMTQILITVCVVFILGYTYYHDKGPNASNEAQPAPVCHCNTESPREESMDLALLLRTYLDNFVDYIEDV